MRISPYGEKFFLQQNTPSHPLRGSSPGGRAYSCLAMLRRNHASPFGRGGAEGDGEGYCAIGAHHLPPQAATSWRSHIIAPSAHIIYRLGGNICN